MVGHETAATAAAPPLSLVARVVGIFTSPRETFRSVAAHPRWLGMLVLATVGSALLTGGFLMTPVGQAAWIEAASAGTSGAQYDAVARMATYVGYLAVAQMIIMVPLVTVITAGILYGVFSTLGGDALFRQVLAVVAHAAPVSLLGQAFTVAVNYARETMASATNLLVFFPMVEEKSFVGRLLAGTDLFIIWWVLVLAIGLGVLYKRRTQPIAVTLYGAYAAIVLVIAVVASRLGSS